VRPAPDGRAPRHSGIWWKPPGAPRETVFGIDRGLRWYEANLSPSRLQTDVRLRARDPLEVVCGWRDQAVRQFRDAQERLEREPGNLEVVFSRAVAAFWLGQDSRALADFDLLIRRAPQAPAGYSYRAVLHARAGRAARARADLEQFLRLSRKPTEKAATAALVAVYLGEAEQGLKQLERDLAAWPGDADWLYVAAAVYARAAEAARLQRLAGVAGLMPAGINPAAGLPALFLAARADSSRRHADRAVQLLRRALAAGHAPPGRQIADADLEPLHSHPGFLALLRQARLDVGFSAVWQQSADRESEQVHCLSPAEHLKRCRALAARGYRPVAVSAAVIVPGQPPLTASVWQRPRRGEPARQALARRQAGAALSLFRLGAGVNDERVWALLRGGPYPEARTRLIHRLGPAGVDAALLVDRLRREKDDSIRRALLLALGQYRAGQLPARLRGELAPLLVRWYRDEADPGIHGAVDWLLRHDPAGSPAWGQGPALRKIDEELRKIGEAGRGKRSWYVNGQGQALTIIDAREPFLMGSPPGEAGRREPEGLHWRRLGRRFAIGARPVTVAEFRRFLRDHPEVKRSYSYTKELSPAEDGPVISLTWYEAAQYCRWLSEQEGVPEHEMVYPSVDEIEKCKDGVTPLRLPADYLKRRGYRLPTEAEWEYACRAGARTSRCYGSSPDFLSEYGWFVDNARNRTWPVGQKKPNDLGLFDMHGNVVNWCQEGQRDYEPGPRQRPAPDVEDRRAIVGSLPRSARGASFVYHPTMARAAQRFHFGPGSRNFTVGLRLARTCK
jgi:formylglycine-generating enzyme required for sulfatase activity